ncbi:MAG: hypothetical protein H6644_19435 [Caldilineaceae bacterium]|nr:hypothetical protein [Caldilineaceae bacterium]
MNSSDGELLDVDRDAAAGVPPPTADIRTLAQMKRPKIWCALGLFAQRRALGPRASMGPLQPAVIRHAVLPAQGWHQQDRMR